MWKFIVLYSNLYIWNQYQHWLNFFFISVIKVVYPCALAPDSEDCVDGSGSGAIPEVGFGSGGGLGSGAGREKPGEMWHLSDVPCLLHSWTLAETRGRPHPCSDAPDDEDCTGGSGGAGIKKVRMFVSLTLVGCLSDNSLFINLWMADRGLSDCY